MFAKTWPKALIIAAFALTSGAARAELNEIKITKQPGLLFTPMLLMEQHKLVEKHASGLNQLKCRVEALKLDAGIGGCKAPVSFDIVSVAVEEPGGNLALEAAPVWDTPIETLIGQDSKLGLGHVEPAAVLGRVVPFEALDEAPCLQRRECLVE